MSLPPRLLSRFIPRFQGQSHFRRFKLSTDHCFYNISPMNLMEDGCTIASRDHCKEEELPETVTMRVGVALNYVRFCWTRFSNQPSLLAVYDHSDRGSVCLNHSPFWWQARNSYNYHRSPAHTNIHSLVTCQLWAWKVDGHCILCSFYLKWPGELEAWNRITSSKFSHPQRNSFPNFFYQGAKLILKFVRIRVKPFSLVTISL